MYRAGSCIAMSYRVRSYEAKEYREAYGLVGLIIGWWQKKEVVPEGIAYIAEGLYIKIETDHVYNNCPSQNQLKVTGIPPKYHKMVKLGLENPSKGKIFDSKRKKSILPVKMKEVQKPIGKGNKGKITKRITATNISFESVMGSKCRTWWELERTPLQDKWKVEKAAMEEA